LVEIWLPYGNTETFVSVNDENLLGILQPQNWNGSENPREEVESALESPLASEPFSKITVQGKKVVVLVELTNPNSKSYMALSHLLGKLREKGVSNQDMKILLTAETAQLIRADKERSDLLQDTFGEYSITGHEPSSECVEVGKTSKGMKVFLNKSFVEAGFKIVFSDVSLHRFFGYRGGCSAILPGMAGADTVKHNHALLTNPNVHSGVLEGNPVYEGMEEASKFAKIDFALCILANMTGDLVKAYAGDLTEAFRAASKEYGEMCRVLFRQKGEIVIASVGGSPYDSDLYHATECLEAALKVVKDDGVVILVAECPKGHGNKVFHEWAKNYKEVREIESEIKKRYILGGENAYCLLKAREKAKIYLVSVMPDYYASNIFKLRTSRTTNSALQSAQRILGKDSKITVLPYAQMTLPIREEMPVSDRT
jgi:nickel-dependent lactate racemase